LRGRKQWIAFGRHVQGGLKVHDKARAALVENGSSLLPVGVLEVEGEFEAGALVTIHDSQGEYGRGLSNYSSVDLRQIAGLRSTQIADVLGRNAPTAAIHRDNLILRENK
jgi:glutamate 5-kinase